jgi:hypothetical protein
MSADKAQCECFRWAIKQEPDNFIFTITSALLLCANGDAPLLEASPRV